MRNLISDSNTSKTADVVEMEKQNGSANELVNELRTFPNSYVFTFVDMPHRSCYIQSHYL